MNPHLKLLSTYESRNVTHLAEDGAWPIVWERAKGVHVWDTDGKKYLDLTGAFAVAATGHANPRVTQAAQRSSPNYRTRWAMYIRIRLKANWPARSPSSPSSAGQTGVSTGA